MQTNNGTRPRTFGCLGIRHNERRLRSVRSVFAKNGQHLDSHRLKWHAPALSQQSFPANGRALEIKIDRWAEFLVTASFVADKLSAVDFRGGRSIIFVVLSAI